MWRPIEDVPHNTDVLILTQEGSIDVANDGFEPDHIRTDARGTQHFEPARQWWRQPHGGGHDYEWDLDGEKIVGWLPLPSNESPLRCIIDAEPTPPTDVEPS
jgi:hypothetical protein